MYGRRWCSVGSVGYNVWDVWYGMCGVGYVLDVWCGMYGVGFVVWNGWSVVSDVCYRRVA